MSGVVQPFWGKIADLFSRPWALTAAVFLYTLGYVVVSASNRVSAVAAGQVIYTAGNAGMIFVQTLLIADITSLQWRGLVLGLVSLPYIPFAFVSGYITDAVSLSNWRWGFGMFCIIMPVAVLPVLMVLFWSEHKAKETGGELCTAMLLAEFLAEAVLTLLRLPPSHSPISGRILIHLPARTGRLSSATVAAHQACPQCH